MNTEHQMSRLQSVCREKSPLCIGLDTDVSYIPPSVAEKFASPAEAVLAYNNAIIAAAGKYAGCFKIQIAYYEAMGLSGLDAYAKTLKAVRATGIPVISDIKRGDIADTAKAYARAHFSGDFETDIITINPYMGFDTLTPFTEWCKSEKGGKGAFVLLCTSNPGMKDIEHQKLADGSILLEKVGNEIARIGAEFKAEYPKQTCGPIGAVVGATQEADARYLRDKYPDVFFLIPGYGAQGGAARVAATLLDKAGGTVNSSRGILCAWKKSEKLAEKRDSGLLTMDDIVEAAAEAAEKSMIDLKDAFNSL
ncbi:MAG: orotidine-5'-phosphate decarboxylase [Spirochaetaceae bacterium]|nr:orotidine-5'-phosphate decarboxylase [Spirochaetaceae bacterium]